MLTRYQAIFLPEADQEQARYRFRTARRKEGEEIHLWHARITALFQRAFPQEDANINVQLREAFRDGLNDPSLAEYIQLSRPANMQDALQMARRKINATETKVRLESQIKSEPGVHAMTRAKRFEFYGNPNASPSTAPLKKPGASSFPAPLPADRARPKINPATSRCFFCHRIGHFANDCRLKKNVRSQRPGPGRRFPGRFQRRRALAVHLRRGFRPLRRRPGPIGRWRRVPVPRRRFFRRFPRGRRPTPRGIYALHEFSDDIDEVLTYDDNDTIDYYYLDMDDDEPDYIAALQALPDEPEDTPHPDEFDLYESSPPQDDLNDDNYPNYDNYVPNDPNDHNDPNDVYDSYHSPDSYNDAASLSPAPPSPDDALDPLNFVDTTYADNDYDYDDLPPLEPDASDDFSSTYSEAVPLAVEDPPDSSPLPDDLASYECDRIFNDSSEYLSYYDSDYQYDDSTFAEYSDPSDLGN